MITDPEKLIGPKELAEHLGISMQHLRNLIAEGRIPFIRVGKTAKRFRLIDVMEALEGGE